MLATDSNFQSIISDVNNLRESSYAIPAGRLEDKTTYWWKVLAKNDTSSSNWSDAGILKHPAVLRLRSEVRSE